MKDSVKNYNSLVKLKNVSKTFKVPSEKKNTIKSYFLNPFRRTEKKIFKALDTVSFSVKKGTALGIIGKNGSGKSTLLKLIAGIYLPNGGRVITRGKVVPFLELGVGFNPELSARDNIFLNGTILGMKRSFLEKKFNEIVDFAEVGEFIDMPLKQYSSGMQVRLAFSIAIQTDADIYLLDEVLAVGDQSFQQRSLDKFKQLKKEKKTIVFVSHNMSQIREYCDQALLLDNGKIRSIGKTDYVIEEYYHSYDQLKREIKDGYKAMIQRVEFLNKQQKRQLSFRTGDCIICRIHYKAKDRIKKPVFGVAIHSSDGIHITGPNTRTSGFQIPYINNDGYIDFIIEKNPLLSGKYFFTAALFNYEETITYDFCEKQFMFDVEKSEPNQYGLLKLEHRWQR
jgi:ABC-type polysaccharide/polyol phosphate transport system ATPase subunit